MKVLTREQMREADRRTIQELGIPGQLLMERAGLSVIHALSEEVRSWNNLNILVLCGGGNNGGDGLVVARESLNKGAKVKVLLLKEPKSHESINNFNWYKKLGGEILTPHDVDLDEVTHWADVIVDAIFGTGFSGLPDPEMIRLFDLVNASTALKVGVDIPSGVDANTGDAKHAIACDLTVTFGAPKVGLIMPPGRFHCGRLKIADIGIPPEFIESNREITTRQIVAQLLPPRFDDSHKGTYGATLIIAGSKNYSGAPLLSAIGAAVTGVGLVYVAVPERMNTLITSYAPELIAIPVPGDHHTTKTLEAVSSILERVSSIAIGPGLGRSKETLTLVLKLLEMKKKLIIDADALNLLSEADSWLVNSDTVITPHPGEFARLTKRSVSETKNNYLLAENYAKMYGVNVLLKGPTTTITSGEKTYFNVLGNSSLAKGGSGDVLTGLIAGFAAQGLSTFEASVIAAFIHARAAEISEKDPRAFSPRDIVENISRVYKEILT
ncbi:MAG TPA: bifunctional ADP-dependent NAD(P)H-hydrate dehydratase/NAD(P)H-hydrate epimerase [Thermotogae bacterium]|nr:bifunctional ADP-dependent NAD(P)H-hydrate dehydratase/NAD(P)H-hydrate epimerase [Thermotogota bacterium]